MADKEISQFTDGSVPSDANYVGGYATANTANGNARWSFANIASYVNTKLGLGTMSTQAASAVAITGGTVDGTVVGGSTPAAATVTTLATGGAITQTVANTTLILKQGANGKTGTVTLNGITPVTVNNSSVTANSAIIFTLKTAHTPGAYPAIATITPTTGFTVAGTVGDISVYNYHIIESAA
jgi:hypothetical protein